MPPLDKKITKIVEAILVAADQPVTLGRLHEVLRDEFTISQPELRTILEQIQARYQQETGLELVEVASGYRIQVQQEMMSWVHAYFDLKPQKISRVMLETMAIIAYQQPVTRGDIERYRGVSTQHGVIRQLLDQDWIKIVGHKEAPGRPELLGTSKGFLNYFNMKSLAELPELPANPELEITRIAEQAES